MKLTTQSAFALGLLATLSLASATQSAPAQADARDPAGSRREFLADMSELTRKCVIRPYSVDDRGAQVLRPLRSVCAELKVMDARHAMIRIEGQTYSGELFDSNSSDRGDLDNLVIKNSDGQIVAVRRNVAAFDEILLALAGGKDTFPLVRE